MIIQCQSCSRKFLVGDTSIPPEGRTVQCGYCSQKWFQTPIKTQGSTKKSVKKSIPENEFQASDGKVYRFLGNQWAEVLSSGKTGILAKKKISKELYKLAGIPEPKKTRKKTSKITEGPKLIDPYSEQIKGDISEGNGLGFFGYIVLLIIIALSAVGILITFKSEILMYFPQAEYVFETMNNKIKTRFSA